MCGNKTGPLPCRPYALVYVSFPQFGKRRIFHSEINQKRTESPSIILVLKGNQTWAFPVSCWLLYKNNFFHNFCNTDVWKKCINICRFDNASCLSIMKRLTVNSVTLEILSFFFLWIPTGLFMWWPVPLWQVDNCNNRQSKAWAPTLILPLMLTSFSESQLHYHCKISKPAQVI